MKLNVIHRTRFTYGAPVRESFNDARLQPLGSARQTCHRFELKVQPSPRMLHYTDFYGNSVHQFEILPFHGELLVEAVSTVTTKDLPVLATGVSTFALGAPDPLAGVERCFDYLQPSTYVDVTPETSRLARSALGDRTDAWQAAQAVMTFVHREFVYKQATTNSHTHMREVLQTRTGVCQDFAHVMLGLCRSVQLPVRYASGYLYNGPADQLKGAQASHAWVEVFIGGAGWVGLDPTNGKIVAGQHVKVAHGRDYADVPPIKGTYRGTGNRTMQVEVQVEPAEEPVTVPA